jgi:hypothetical protein
MAETNQERAERVLGLEPGEVSAVGVKPHANGVEVCAVLRAGTFSTRTVGAQVWEPPPLKVTVKRAVVGEQVVGKRVVGREEAGKDAAGEPLFRDLTEDVMGPAFEGDAALEARARAEGEAQAKAKGWRRVTVEGVEVGEKAAVVTVVCG